MVLALASVGAVIDKAPIAAMLTPIVTVDKKVLRAV